MSRSRTASRPRGLSVMELECMQVLWRERGATVAEVRQALSRPLAYTTVMTVLDRMAAKGVVERQRRGRAWVYSPGLDLERARGQAVEHVVRHLFAGDRQALVEYLARTPSAGRTASTTSARRREESEPVASGGIDDSLL